MKSKLTDMISFRVPTTIKKKIAELAEATQRKESDILLGWVCEKLDSELWQIEQINRGIKEADTGEFANDEEIATMRAKWKV
jgi:predicted transcriptional regulator